MGRSWRRSKGCSASRRAPPLAARAAATFPVSRLVVTVTGHGLKDVEAAERHAPEPVLVDADPDAIDGGVVIVKAPATSANLGPGFDCVGVALDLWNELEVTDGTGGGGGGGSGAGSSRPTRRTSAYAPTRAWPPRGPAFPVRQPDPARAGAGSSAAAIALGLVAAAPRPRPTTCSPPRSSSSLMRTTSPPRSSAGDIRLRRARRPDRGSLPLTPVAVIPESRVRTQLSRDACRRRCHMRTPPSPRATQRCSAPRSRTATRPVRPRARRPVHEPYRPSAVLEAVRRDLPTGARGPRCPGRGRP